VLVGCGLRFQKLMQSFLCMLPFFLFLLLEMKNYVDHYLLHMKYLLSFCHVLYCETSYWCSFILFLYLPRLCQSLLDDLAKTSELWHQVCWPQSAGMGFICSFMPFEITYHLLACVWFCMAIGRADIFFTWYWYYPANLCNIGLEWHHHFIRIARRVILHRFHAVFVLPSTCSHLRVLWFGGGSVGVCIFVLCLCIMESFQLLCSNGFELEIIGYNQQFS